MTTISESKIAAGYTYVNDGAGLARINKMLQGTARVGMDTEADSLHHYFEKVCLIQLSFLGKNYIIDPLAGFSLGEFFEVLSKKELIFHGADYDLRILKKSFGFRPTAPVYDTMLAAQVLGYEKIGLAALIERFFGISMSKAGQKADWSQRPLPERLLTYASDDTRYLEAITDALTCDLEKLNRTEWHKECCERAVKTSVLPDRNADKEAWRVKGSFKLGRDALVFVQALWQWRDEEAKKKDRPPFMILHNEDLIALAQWRPKNLQTPLHAGPVFLRRFTGEKLARLENAIRSAENVPKTQWPLPEKTTPWREERPDQGKLEQMLAACKTLAAQLQIQSFFLAPRSALTAVVQHQPRSVEKVMEVSGMMRWQAELLMPAIETLLGNWQREKGRV